MSGTERHSTNDPRAGAASPAALAVLRRRAMEAYRAGRPRVALESCREILALQPDRPDVLSVAGTLAAELGELEDAVGFHGRAVELKPDFVEARYNLANALQQLGRFEAAAEAYRRTLALKPDLVPALHNLGSVLQSLGDHEMAAKTYARVLARELNPETLRNCGVVLEALDRRPEAIAAFRRALAGRPDWPAAHSNLIHALLLQGEPQAAPRPARIGCASSRPAWKRSASRPWRSTRPGTWRGRCSTSTASSR
jgi:protein O-GlcNAc transferase